MGWFVIACICGFLAYRGWQPVSNWLGRARPIGRDLAQFLSVAIAFGIVSAGLLLWAYRSRHAHSFEEAADIISDGTVARFMLGVVLGTGAAFVINDRLHARGDHDGAAGRGPDNAPLAATAASGPPAVTVQQPTTSAPGSAVDQATPAAAPSAEGSSRVPPAGGGDAAGGDSGGKHAKAPKGRGSSGLGTHLTLSMGLGITILALTAPHIDRWLSNITTLKSPLIELQLNAATTQRISVAANAEELFNSGSLTFLKNYEFEIQSDIEFLEKYGQDTPNHDSILAAAKELHPTFATIVTPIATCVQAAIDKNLVSIDSARQMVKPTVDLLEQIIFGEALLSGSELSAKHDQFWQQMLGLPKTLASLVKTQECAQATAIYYADGMAPESATLFPRIQDYPNVPYLHVAAASLISFMADGDTALKVLQNARPKLDNRKDYNSKDYTFLVAIAELSYYQGKPGDVSGLYLRDLNEMRATARRRIQILQRDKQECSAEGGLLCREQMAEFTATNAAAYSLAEDLARKNLFAVPYAAQLEEYAEQIKRWMDDLEKFGAEKNVFYSSIQEQKHVVLDTYAYAVLVLESRKKIPDRDLIRKKVIPVFRNAIDYFGRSVPRESGRRDPAFSNFKIAQEHLATAEAFVGE